MVILTIILACALIAAFVGLYAYNKAYEELRSAYLDRAEEHNKLLLDIKYLNFFGSKCLKIEEGKPLVLSSFGNVGVCLQHPNNPLCKFLIKRFYYKLGDEEDKAFAYREAEELIETIQKA